MKAEWYLTRATGAVALVLLTAALVLGILAVGRVRTRRWPRFALDGIHRTLALLAVVFLAVHIATAVLDSFAPITLVDAVVPFVGAYRPLWLGLGAVAFDLLLAVGATSLLRRRVGHRVWRGVHWLAYAMWPIALLHGLGTGSDVHNGWMADVYFACGAAALGAVLARIAIGWPAMAGRRLAALAGTGAFVIAIALWLPSGPLAPGWAARAGTPKGLLPHAARGRT